MQAKGLTAGDKATIRAVAEVFDLAEKGSCAEVPTLTKLGQILTFFGPFFEL